MLPQKQRFNSGDWETVEKFERQLATNHVIHIIAGGIGNLGLTPGGVVEPEYMWKAILINGIWTCWMMPNKSTSVHHAFDFWIISLNKFNALTHMNLTD